MSQRRRRRGSGALLCLVALATAGLAKTMAAEEPGSAGETEIRALIDRVVHAIRARDVDGVMSAFAPDVVSFDIGPPLQHGGGPAFAARWRELFDAYRGPIEYEVHDLDVTADDAVAFSHSLNRIAGTLENGRTSERWLRWTACYRRVEGRWRIVHEQVSVPVDPRDGKALLDLKP